MAASNELFIRHQLETRPAADCDVGAHTTADCKMRLLYARCIDTPAIDAVGAQPLQHILDDLGGWSALGLSLFDIVYFYRAPCLHISWNGCR